MELPEKFCRHSGLFFLAHSCTDFLTSLFFFSVSNMSLFSGFGLWALGFGLFALFLGLGPYPYFYSCYLMKIDFK